MTAADALAELLGRIGAARDGVVLVGDDELQDWPSAAVTAFKSAGLLAEASPARSVICPGCERQCTMPVYVLSAKAAINAFVVCDKRHDINRVPIEPDSLKRWQGSGEAVAKLLARLLHQRRRSGTAAIVRRWEIGIFKGRKGTSHLVLIADGELKLGLAGHTSALSEVLSFKGRSLVVDKAALIDCVDHPASGGGDRASAGQRRARLVRRVEELKRQSRRDFLKTVAQEEGISPQRLKQIIGRRKAPQ
jgi:hypothetical protein